MTAPRHFCGFTALKSGFSQPFFVLLCLVLCAVTLSYSAQAKTAPVQATPSKPALRYNCALQSQILLAQCNALVELYQHTNGKNWQNVSHTPWLSNNTPCSWDGLRCENKQVVKLNLKNKGLRGRLPALSHLTGLEQLILSENPELRGPLPDLSGMEGLVTLEIAATGLAGFLPDLSNFAHLERFDVRNSQFIGPVPMIPLNTRISVSNNYLCMSPRLKYTNVIHKIRRHYPTCRPMLSKILRGKLTVTDFGAIPNDNQPDDKIINHAINMLSLTLPRKNKLKDIILHFPAGTYDMNERIKVRNFEEVELSGVAGARPVSILRKTAQFGNSQNKLIKKSKHGALLDIRNGRGLTVQNLRLEGQLKNENDPFLWWDHGIYVGSVFESRIGNNAFYHFGDSALTITSDAPGKERSYRGSPKPGINSARHMVFANYFYNITQTSTTSTFGGSAEYSFVHNTVEHVKGAIKFATRKAGAGNLNIANNHITSAGINTNFDTNNGIEIEGYTNVKIENNTLSNGKGVGIVIRSAQSNKGDTAYNWGNVSVMHNTISQYRQGVYVSNLPHNRDGSIAKAEKIVIENNTLSHMWNGEKQAAIQFVGSHYQECRVSNNTIVGGKYGLWSAPVKPGQKRWMMAEGNMLN